MIAKPDDYAWFSRERFPELADTYCFTYVRGLTPEELVTRLGVRVEACSRMTLDELIRGQTFGAVSVGDWVLLVEAYGGLGVTEEIIVPLSAGTRLVSHFYLDVDGMDYFHWIDDGKIRFEYLHQEGYSHWIKDGKLRFEFPHHESYSEEMPDELAEIMERISHPVYPIADPHEGPAFLMAESLTGITMTPQLLEESTYLGGGVPRSR
jgi:transcriptional regulator with XRE-family HTH domain